MITRTEFRNALRTTTPASAASEAAEAAEESSDTATTTTPSTTEAEPSAFEGSLREYLASFAGQEVSEEELFAGVVRERLQELKSTEAVEQYDTYLSTNISQSRRGDGYVGYEDAAKNALRSLVSDGSLTVEEGDALYSESFDAAQLDDRRDALFDDRGGPNDPTIAAADSERAIASATTAIAAYTAGQTAPQRALSEATPGKSAFVSDTSSMSSGSTHHSSEGGDDGTPSEQFLYKPISDTTGKLVIVTPAAMAGDIVSLKLKGPDGNLLEQGTFGGNGNGGRDHFRFSKPGERYPDELTVEIRLSDGSLKTYVINDSSERNEQ
jgi:hypothetical protein